MRDIPSRSATFAFVAGLALAVAGCSGSSEPAAEADANLAESNLILDEPANDASAMESADEVTQPVDVFENSTANEAEETEPLGETSGGDTGGNTVDSNVSGM
jgi:hypothetical protein